MSESCFCEVWQSLIGISGKHLQFHISVMISRSLKHQCAVSILDLMQSIWSNTFYVNKILVFSWYSSSLLMNLGRFSLLVNYTCTEIRNGGLLFNFRQYLNKIVHSFLQISWKWTSEIWWHPASGFNYIKYMSHLQEEKD